MRYLLQIICIRVLFITMFQKSINEFIQIQRQRLEEQKAKLRIHDIKVNIHIITI